MYVEINSYNVAGDCVGKTSTVESPAPTFEGWVRDDFYYQPGDKGIWIRLEQKEQKGDGSRGGDPKVIIKRAIIKISLTDLQCLLAEAIEERVLDISFASELAEAKKHLDLAVESLKKLEWIPPAEPS